MLNNNFQMNTRIPRNGCVAWKNKINKEKLSNLYPTDKGYFRETYNHKI